MLQGEDDQSNSLSDPLLLKEMCHGSTVHFV